MREKREENRVRGGKNQKKEKSVLLVAVTAFLLLLALGGATFTILSGNVAKTKEAEAREIEEEGEKNLETDNREDRGRSELQEVDTFDVENLNEKEESFFF